ncbi:hypothetical protein SSA02_15330 [Swaminathania salitolerans]|uniref:Uncharacterized protein n=1 Tax=Swaminathania salitolerans TaxID=182838 RepID=A0A511BPX2_9PROT|nr:hypothetical protein SSA02_15330 [Swaminathania salitolerans]
MIDQKHAQPCRGEATGKGRTDRTGTIDADIELSHVFSVPRHHDAAFSRAAEGNGECRAIALANLVMKLARFTFM